MKQSLRHLAILSLTAVIVSACADDSQQPTEAAKSAAKPPAGTIVAPASPKLLSYVTPSCPPTQADAQKAIDTLLPQLFAPGNARRGKAQNLSNDMEKARYANNVNLANAKADSLINFSLQQYYAGLLLNQSSDLAGTQQRLVSFITYVYCFNGYSPLPDFDQLLNASTSVLIRNETPTTVVTDPTKFAGVKVNQGDVPATVNGQPFFGTYISVVKTTNPLPTSLDWYGIDGYKAGAFEFVSDPEVTFTSPVLTGVCISYDDAIVTSPNDLRLAHTAPAPSEIVPGNAVVTTAGGSIEVLAPEQSSFAQLGLSCTALPIQSASAFGRAVDWFTSVLLPAELLAGATSGGTSGKVSNFSPFAAVDIRLATSSTGPSSPQYIPLNATTTTAPVTVTAKTRNSQAGIDNIPVAFATSTAGSSFTPTSANTNTSGTASSSWTLVAGANTGSGTPTLAPLVFTPAAASFSVNAIQETTLSFDGPLTLPDGVQGTAYPSTTFTASGGIGTYAWSYTGTLPTGLALSSGGVLSGTATAAGNFSFSVSVASGSQTQSRSYSVTVSLPPVTITTTSPLPAATIGAAYSRTLQASGGAGAGSYSWALASGSSLPAGLGLSAAGVISGTPTALGTTSFTVVVTSGTGATAVTSSKAFSLSVINPTAINISFDVAPSKSVCYALGVPMTPGIRVKVTDQSGNLLSGVAVGMVAVTNNGAKVDVSPSSVVSSNGISAFGGPTINKTGGYALIASTTSPWPAATVTSQKFTISPSCS